MSHQATSVATESVISTKGRAKRAVLLLFSRSIVARSIGFVGSVILARYLTPSDYGLFAIGAFFVESIRFASDAGLVPALVREKEEPSRAALVTVFTVQLFVTVVMGMGLALAAGWIAAQYNLGTTGVWLVRALAASLPFTAFRVPITVRLERDLDYLSIVRADLVEMLVYQTVTVGGAMWGLGVWSLVIGTLLRGIVGLMVLYASRPWRPALGFHWGVMRGLLRFGIPYQGSVVVSLVRDSLTPTLVGMILGTSAVGLVQWGQRLATFPFSLVQSVWIVTLPTFSRLQEDVVEMRHGALKILRISTTVLTAFYFLGVGLAYPLVDLLYTSTWRPGVPVLYLYSLALCVGGPISAALSGPLYALGLSSRVLLVVTVHTIVLWLSAFLLLRSWGPVAVGVAQLVAVITDSAGLMYLASRHLRIHAGDVLWAQLPPLTAGVLACLVTWLGSRVGGSGITGILFGAVAGVAVYAAFLYVLARPLWQEVWVLILQTVNLRASGLKNYGTGP